MKISKLPQAIAKGIFFMYMKLTQDISGEQIDVGMRPKVRRDDLAMHTTLFQRDVVSLMHIDPNTLRDICISLCFVHRNIEQVVDGLVDHFRSETHYRRRNKLRERITLAIKNKRNALPIAGGAVA